ncbi:MAG: T9SS type A sorting domain-containing protein [Lewinellaceae bacterium]|nr:T9SS type A sorting domain-containing protein [Lewinellaceae bacterium]
MKKRNVIVLVFLIFHVGISKLESQDPLISKKVVYRLNELTDEEYIKARSSYVYDENERIVDEIIEETGLEDTELDFSRRIIYHYEDTLIRKDFFWWNTELETWYDIGYHHFEYDDYGCLSREFYEFQETRGEIVYLNDTNCQKEEIIEKEWFRGEFLRGLKKEIFRADTMEEILSIEIDSQGFEIFELGKRIIIYDEEGRRIRLWYNDSDFQAEHLETYEYYETNGNLAKIESYYKVSVDSEWEKDEECNISYEYDQETNRIIRKISSCLWYIVAPPLERIRDINYEFDCNGNLEEEIIISEDGELEMRTIYEYLDSILCEEEIDSVYLAPMELKIYPNPAKKVLYVDWKEWQNKSANIQIYDLKGVKLDEKQFPEVIGRVELNLSVYSDKLLLISIQTDSDLLIKKIIRQE